MLNWICGIFAVLLALIVSSLELLTKYEAKKFKEIFGSPYYWAGFVPLNAVFSAAVYLALPYLSKLVLTSDLTTNLENPVLRALVAGLGYLIIVRTSIVDLKIGNETQGIGFDILYKRIAGYILRHHETAIQRREEALFDQLYVEFKDPRIYLGAAEMLLARLRDDSSIVIKNEIRAVINALVGEKPPGYTTCYKLYKTLLEASTEYHELQKWLQQAQTQIETDPAFQQKLTRTLDWLSLA
jgi:hypothetical protein